VEADQDRAPLLPEHLDVELHVADGDEQRRATR
jgi:hypothetical protein